MKGNYGKIAGMAVLTVGCMAVLCGHGLSRSWMAEGEHGEEEPISFRWFCDEPLWQPEDWEAEKGTGTGRITEQTGVTVSYVIPEDNGDSRLSLMMIQKDMPDIVSVSDGKMLRYLIESEQVWEIGELLETFYPQARLLSEYPPDIREKQTERDGGWYGIGSDLHSPDNQKRYREPEAFYREYQEQESDLGIIWNRALLKRLGMDTDGPRTEQEAVQLFEEVKEKELRINAKPVIPLLVDGTNYQETTMEALYGFFGASSLDEQGTYRDRLGTKEGKHAAAFLNRMVREGYVDGETFLMNHYTVSRTLNSGQVLAFIGDIRHSGIDPTEWVSSGAILAEDGTKPVTAEPEEVSCQKMTTLVSKSCEHPEKAARWLDYMMSEEGMRSYLDSCGKEEWWPLRDEDWYYSVQTRPDETVCAWKQLLCAFSRLPQTNHLDACHTYGISESWLREKEKESAREGKTWINRLIMAQTAEDFERIYEEYKNQEK